MNRQTVLGCTHSHTIYEVPNFHSVQTHTHTPSYTHLHIYKARKVICLIYTALNVKNYCGNDIKFSMSQCERCVLFAGHTNVCGWVLISVTSHAEQRQLVLILYTQAKSIPVGAYISPKLSRPNPVRSVFSWNFRITEFALIVLMQIGFRIYHSIYRRHKMNMQVMIYRFP